MATDFYTASVTKLPKPGIRSTRHWSRSISSLPASITPSQGEIKTRQLSPQNVATAIRSLYHDGLVVVEDVIPHDSLNRLNQKMVTDAYTLQSKKENSPYKYNPGNIQQDAPPVLKYFDPETFLNPIATQITSTALDPRPNHSDADFDHPDHPFAYVVNIPLITMTPENGSTELWLGTHTDSGLHVQEGVHGDRASGRIMPNELERRRAIRPPSQPAVHKKSLFLRDLRLWHAGVAMIHFAPWYRNPMRLELAEDLRLMIEGQSSLEVPVDWVSEADATLRYLTRTFGNSYDFSQGQ
ncbi:hypothetical protein BDV25DRAFT_128868 [Aspergillus avenaceus]|uniref:Phytanoyl-CoA dioxygenase family protein n=1 Tax=Aspergillus avenaceus TaxID=36643 RepID=A0A5N6TY87_ASPAV|nr:hypothetical protein BDV25DRAFT_128868 [Aspergillus avenaceus]